MKKIIFPFCFTLALLTACAVPITTSRPTVTITATATETPTLPTPIPPPPTVMPAPSESASEIAFWAKLGSMPTNVLVMEHPVLRSGEASNQSPKMAGGFNRHLATPVKFVDIPTPKPRTFQDVGYEIVYGPDEPAEGGGTTRVPYFGKNGKVLIDGYFLKASNVYTFSTPSGTVTAFIVTTESNLRRNEYIIQNGKIIPWGVHTELDPWLPPVLYQDDLLWAKLSYSHIDVKKSNGDVVFTTPVFWMTGNRSRFRTWQGHWVLQADNVVAVDGESLNAKFDFSKVFLWDLIHDRPIFLFQKQVKYGISYNGQVLPLQYDEIAYGMCCMPAQNNPWVHDNWVSFFGRRDGVWYAVVLAFK